MSVTNVITVGPKGRVVIPVEVRRALGLTEGSELVALIEGDAVVLLPRSSVRDRLRSLFAGVEGSMAGELIEERRAAAKEDSRA
ncbi:MAG: AbrB/MazE/SpoVT family DNA-binding domain-containing protein [Chloroflexi bacterium]|nr:AbrB/MazE/SpoVT family DNA-binding domain-containing protein [Chloroflexota bacterium]